MNTINIFFSGKEVDFATNPRNDWEKFGPGLDTVRLFEVCAASWRKNGWDVARLSTRDTSRYAPTDFSLTGQCARSFAWYPSEQWQFIAAAKAVAAFEPEKLHRFACIDVINQTFAPQDFDAKDGRPGPVFMNFQKEHFSLSLFATNYAWLCEAEEILLAYDRGELAPLNLAYVSDETILRFYASGWGGKNLGLLSFGLDSDRLKAPLLHFSRSCAARLYEEIPLSL